MVPINSLNRIHPLLHSVLGIAMAISQAQPAQAQSVNDRLNRIDQSMELCLNKASRPGFPYYDRPEAKEACDETKSLLKAFAKDANRNRNLGCSNRAIALNFNLRMIQFLGEARMRQQTASAVSKLHKNCYNMDTR